MQTHPLAALIAAADRAISTQDYEVLLDFYAEDAALVVKPGLVVHGKAAIQRAFEGIAEHFGHRLRVGQGEIQVIEGADSALVVMETLLTFPVGLGREETVTRRATYVFRRDGDVWRCVIDNSYGTDLLTA